MCLKCVSLIFYLEYSFHIPRPEKFDQSSEKQNSLENFHFNEGLTIAANLKTLSLSPHNIEKSYLNYL
jgi:hypothetical protein